MKQNEVIQIKLHQTLFANLNQILTKYSEPGKDLISGYIYFCFVGGKDLRLG